MEEQNSLNNNMSSKMPYTKINSNEDIFLDLKVPNTQQLFSDQINSSYNGNEIDNDYQNINNNSINNIKPNKHQKIGILNRKIPNYFYMKIGNTFTFLGDKDGSPLIVIGPHWPMFLCFNSFICIGYICFFYFFWNNMSLFIKFFGIIILLTFFISYTITFLMNPGIPKYDENAILGQPREKYTFCNLCKIWVNNENKTSHCFDCNVCVEGYDHHCPWTGKCIGKKNLKYFYIFLMSILFVFCFFAIALTLAQNDLFEKRKAKRNKNKIKK